MPSRPASRIGTMNSHSRGRGSMPLNWPRSRQATNVAAMMMLNGFSDGTPSTLCGRK
jgi:hypothetical protein